MAVAVVAPGGRTGCVAAPGPGDGPALAPTLGGTVAAGHGPTRELLPAGGGATLGRDHVHPGSADSCTRCRCARRLHLGDGAHLLGGRPGAGGGRNGCGPEWPSSRSGRSCLCCTWWSGSFRSGGAIRAIRPDPYQPLPRSGRPRRGRRCLASAPRRIGGTPVLRGGARADGSGDRGRLSESSAGNEARGGPCAALARAERRATRW